MANVNRVHSAATRLDYALDDVTQALTVLREELKGHRLLGPLTQARENLREVLDMLNGADWAE